MKVSFRPCKFCTCFLIASSLVVHAGSAHADSIARDQVNIRSGPSLKSDIMFQAPLGYPITIRETKGNWVHFRDWVNGTGWVHKSFISKDKTAVVLVDKANLRSSPGEKSRVVGKAKQGEIYKVLARKSNWIHLGYFFDGGAAGWVRSDLVFGG